MNRSQNAAGVAVIERRRALTALAACVCLFLTGATLRADSFPPGWSPELGDAFGLYYAGRYSEAGSACRAIVAASRSQPVRRDAEALAALALMRLDTRNDRVEGRTRLGQLARESLSLMDRPDCRFALGVARAGLNETSSALGELLAALDGFQREKRNERVLEAQVAIADTWSRFGEWSMPIPGLPLVVPESAEAADRERERRVVAVRGSVAALPDSANALRRIDFIAARMKLTQSASRAMAMDALRALAATDRLDEFAADAATALAEALDQDKRGDEAIALYQRVAAAGLGERSRRAETLSADALRPRIDLSVASTPRPGRPMKIMASANRVRSIELELRRIDLAQFLTDRQGTLAEQHLPDDGAMIGTKSLAAPPDNAGRWTADADFDPPAGAMVAIAHGLDAGGKPIRAKQLFVVSELDAAVIAGSGHGMVAASGATGKARARFWMQGSYVPVEIALPGGCATFVLPPEARLLRDRRWVCLVESETGLALCRGSLPEAGDADAGRSCVVSIAPDRPRVGDELTIAGMLISDARHGGPNIVRGGVEVEICDTFDEVRARANATVDAAGVFVARVRIAPELAGSIVHAVVRAEKRVVAPLVRPVTVHISSGESRSADLELNLATLGAANEGLLRGEMRAFSPWGRPLAGVRGEIRLRAVRLPTSDDDAPRVASPTFGNRARFDDAGRASLSQPMAVFQLPAGPIAINAELTVVTADERTVSTAREALFGGGPAHVWIDSESKTTGVGDDAPITVGWFDPQSLASGGAPALAIRAPGGEFVDFPLRPDRGGMLSADWSPWRGGQHELRATLKLSGGQTATALRKIEVRPQASGRPGIVNAFAAQFRAKDRAAIDVSVDTAESRSLLVVILSREPLAAAWLAAQKGDRRVSIEIPSLPAAGAIAALFDLCDGALIPLGSTPVATAQHTLKLAGTAVAFSPGGIASLTIESNGGVSLDGASLLGRLTAADDSGAVDWMLRSGPLGGAPRAAALLACGSGWPGSIGIHAADPLAASAALALTRSGAFWADVSRAQRGALKIRVPLPAAAGDVRLRGVAAWPDGRVAVLDELLTVRAPVSIQSDLPDTVSTGDRSLAAICVRNESAKPVSGTLRAIGGRGLRLGQWSIGSGRAELSPTAGEPAASVSLPAHSTVYLRLAFEATGAGRGSLRFEFAAEGDSSVAEAFYRVLESPAATETQPAGTSARAAVRVSRKLFTIAPLDDQAPEQRDPSADPRASQQPALANRPRFELRDDEPLALGTIVLVEETIETDGPLREISWAQRVPANCTARPEKAREWQALSAVREIQPSQISGRIEQLAAGKALHEYALIVSRPGACALPLPVVRAQSTTLRPELKSSNVRIVAAE